MTATLTTEDCLDYRPGMGECSGAVEYRMALTATGKSFPRCDQHWDERLEAQREHDRIYPDSPFPPAWFDPMNAGERWDYDY